jgi:hypothetical protein
MSMFVVRRTCRTINQQHNHTTTTTTQSSHTYQTVATSSSYGSSSSTNSPTDYFGPTLSSGGWEGGDDGGGVAGGWGNASHPNSSAWISCESAAVSASASLWMNYIWFSCNLPNMLTALALGTLSDCFGRRPVMIWCVFTQMFGSMGMA